MVYRAYELIPKFKYLSLSGIDGSGELNWIGTKEQWEKAEREIAEFEYDEEEWLINHFR